MSASTSDLAADFKRAMALSAERKHDESRRLLEATAAAGHPDAVAWLGLHALYGYGGKVDPARALELMLDAEAKGSAEASHQLALYGWCGILAPRDPTEMARRLMRAAEGDNIAALRSLALMYLKPGDAQLGRAAEQCLLRAAALLDPVAYSLLALLWTGHDDPTKRQAAPGFMASAAVLGVLRATKRATPGVAPVRVEADPLRDLPAPEPDTSVQVARQRHHEQPVLETVDRFFSPLECEYLIAWADPFLHQALVVAATGELQQHPDRNNAEALLVGVREDFSARWLQARMTDWLGVPLGQAEHLSLLRYEPGQEYRPHVDYFRPGVSRNLPAPEPGQRVHTVFVYLDDVEAGGETEFPRLGKRVRPARGRIVHFTNCGDDGLGDPATVHAGLPVRAGVKYLATLWTRERAFRRY